MQYCIRLDGYHRPRRKMNLQFDLCSCPRVPGVAEHGGGAVRRVRVAHLLFSAVSGSFRCENKSNSIGPLTNRPSGEGWAMTGACSLIVALGTVASLASVASSVVVNKDWVAVIAAGDKHVLASESDFLYLKLLFLNLFKFIYLFIY